MDIVPLSSGLRFPGLPRVQALPSQGQVRSAAGEPKVSFLGLLIPAGALKRTSFGTGTMSRADGSVQVAL